jgi:histidine triad (HIT) family protein
MAKDDCIFCSIIKGEIPGKKVYEDEGTFAFRDINPQAPVHIIIVPKRHVARVRELKEEDIPMDGQLILLESRHAKKEGIEESGYRLVFNCNAGAGQSVFHIHLHLLGGRRMTWPPG